jgi:predicted phosphodiesterase
MAHLPAGKRLFSFVVVADTHVNEHEDRSLSPFRTNALANGRARHVMHEIAALDPAPAFVVHLGDIVHPVPSLPAYSEAAARYKAIAAALQMPVHLVPGNHDIGDKSVDWMPADIVCDEFIKTYRKAFGADYFSFDHGPARCIVINAQLINSGLPGEAQQREWLESGMAAHAGKRIFLFSHYPPYVHTPDERSTYDNIDQPGRDWLLELVRRHRVEAVFAGHVHNFWYDQIDKTEFYLLPSTAFLRHDYSEFYRVAPGNEFGRGDAGKFGYCVVDVHEVGHVMRLVRTGGRSLAPEAQFAPRNTVPPMNVKIATVNNVGVELRHAWAEVMEIPSTGGVQEFGRKPARNDYPVMALWEMGARLLKVPDHDLTNAYTRSRMQILRSVGHRFVTTSLGVPNVHFVEALAAAPDLIDIIEVNLSARRLERDLGRLRSARTAANRPVYWSKLRMHEDAHFDGAQFSHFVTSGMMPGELDDPPALLAQAGARDAVDGIVVRLERGVDLLVTMPALVRFAERSGLAVQGSIKLADAGLAKIRDDETDNARLAAEAVLAGRLSDRVSLIFDTFMDIDRGYHPRNGFIDRMFNPRPALRAYAAMAHVLGDAKEVVIERIEQDEALRTVRFSTHGTSHFLVSGRSGPAVLDLAERSGARNSIDLCTGEFGTLSGPAGGPGENAPGESNGVWILTGVR